MPPKKDDERRAQIHERLEKINGVLLNYTEIIAGIQGDIATSFMDEFGKNGPIDLNSIAKLARITSNFAKLHGASTLKAFPKALQNCQKSWSDLRCEVICLPKTLSKKYSMIPARLAFAFFYNGQNHEAVKCIIDYLSLTPDDMTAKELVIKWLIYLGETEMAENKMTDWKMAQNSKYVGVITELYIQYVKSREARNDLVEKINTIHEEIKQEGVIKKSFSAYILSSYSSWIVSTLSQTPVVGNLQQKEFPDRATNLNDSVNKTEAVVRNRIPGMAPYSFDNSESADIHKYFEKKGKMVKPLDYIEVGSEISMMYELRREWALLNISIAQTRDAVSAMILNWRAALKSASYIRILQSINTAYYSYNVIEEPESIEAMKIMRATMINVLSPEAMIVRCSTPVKENELTRAQTPSISRKAANIPKDETMVAELTDKMADLEMMSDQPLHIIARSCGCFLCSMYPKNSTLAAEYMFSSTLYHGFSQKAMAQFDSEFAQIRERLIPIQCLIFGYEDIRPRPPIILSEIFGMCAIRWISLKGERKEKPDAVTDAIIQSTQKITRYVQMRTAELMITFNHLVRQYQTPTQKNLSWMRPIEKKTFVRVGIETARDIMRAVSPFGQRQKLTIEEEKEKENETTTKVETLRQEGKNEMNKYSHFLYREWRAKAFSYTARQSTNLWESAFYWAESTSISARNAVQQKLGKCGKGLVTLSGPDRLRKCVEKMSPDMTLIQISIGDDGNVYMIKLHTDRYPIIMPIAHKTQMHEMMEKFTHLLLEDEKIAKNPGNRTPEQFWTTRKAIDERIRTFVTEVEENFLDVAAYLLLPSGIVGTKTVELAEKMERLTRGLIRTGEAKEFIHLTTLMTESEWKRLMDRITEMKRIDAVTTTKIKEAYQRCQTAMTQDAVPKNEKSYTYLAICPDLSQFCWEHLPIYENHPYVCRMISIHAMFCQLEAIQSESKPIPLQIDVQKAYYVLDPENNLGDTKQRMMEYINKFDWEGTVGTAPEAVKVTAALEKKDAFFYFGHGSGSKVISRNTIKQSKCNAISLLMGCGSVRTIPQGVGFDGKSALLEYALANCPLVVGCLWTVTDGEIDRYLMRMVDDCFVREGSGGSGGSGDEPINQLRQLTEAMKEAASKAKLRYLTGASVVMYGFPVVSKPEVAKMEKSNEEVAVEKVQEAENVQIPATTTTASTAKSPARKKAENVTATPKKDPNVLRSKLMKVFEEKTKEKPEEEEASIGRRTPRRARK